MTSREQIEREGYQIRFVKKPTKIIAIANNGFVHLTAEGKDEARALFRLKTVVRLKGYTDMESRIQEEEETPAKGDETDGETQTEEKGNRQEVG